MPRRSRQPSESGPDHCRFSPRMRLDRWGNLRYLCSFLKVRVNDSMSSAQAGSFAGHRYYEEQDSHRVRTEDSQKLRASCRPSVPATPSGFTTRFSKPCPRKKPRRTRTATRRSIAFQPYEGVVTRYRKGTLDSTFTVRKISAGGIGVERVFPTHSPFIDRIEVLAAGVVNRARLFFLRERTGKAARIRKPLSWPQERCLGGRTGSPGQSSVRRRSRCRNGCSRSYAGRTKK